MPTERPGRRTQSEGASGVGGVSADYIEKREFRLLLLYVARYVRLLALFRLIDADGDSRVDLREFSNALPLLEPWGVNVADPASAFAAIDANGGGFILFDEFAHWGLGASMQALRDRGASPAQAKASPSAKNFAHVASRVSTFRDKLLHKPSPAARCLQP